MVPKSPVGKVNHTQNQARDGFDPVNRNNTINEIYLAAATIAKPSRQKASRSMTPQTRNHLTPMKQTRNPMLRKLASVLSVRCKAAAFAATATLIAATASALPTISISTTNGSGADAYVSGWAAGVVGDSGSSNNGGLWCRKATDLENQVTAIRFDLTGYSRAGYTSFSLDLIQYRTNAPKTFAFYAVRDGAVGEDNNGTVAGYTDNNWDESQILFSTMPGLHWANTSTADQTPNADAILLGTIAASDVATNKGRIISFRSPALNDFVLTNADDVVTFLIVGGNQNEAGSNNLVRLASEELTALDGGAPTNIIGTFAARLLFDPPSCAVPIVLQNPANQAASAGGTATFTAWFGYDTNTPAFQWQLSTNSGTTWNDISGANATSYTTPTTSLADSGNRYRCIATGCSVSVTNEGAILTVSPPPAIWTGGTGDWNVNGNWSTLLVPGPATNALIPSNSVVNYTAPMLAPTLGALTNFGTLNISASGFNAGQFYMTRPVGGGKLFLNSGGAASITGNFGASSNAAISIVPGSSLSVGGELYLGAGTSGGGTATGTGLSIAFLTNSGGTFTTAGLRLNAGNGSVSASSRALIDGGVNNLGNALAGRESGGNSAPPGLGTSGIVISNGLVNMTSLRIGNNAHGTVLVAGGVTTNTGGVFLANSTTTRAARYIQRGGFFVTQGSVTNGGSGSAQASYSVTGGTNLVGGIRFGADGSTGISWFTNSATMYIGAGGISHNGLDTVVALLNPGGLFGATTDWTGSYPMTLGAGSFIFKAAGLDEVAHNITLTGALTGTGPLVKTGGGTLTLDAAQTYSAATLVNQGALALGSSGTLTSSEIQLASGTVFDVSGALGYTLAAGQTLSGFGGVAGDVSVASTAILSPGTNGATGTLTLSNSVTQTGGARNVFDLSANPAGPNNDLIVVGGDLNCSGVNNIEVTGGGAAGSVHPLIQYGGTFNGDVNDFSLIGINGVITNNTVAKVIAVRVTVTVRQPTNVVWVGNALANDWDTLNTTNWVTNGGLTYFVSGDNALFNATGAANANVNIASTVTPGSVTVNATTDYEFNGAGLISGAGSLTKTNTGKLTITSVNAFTGGLNLLGGTLSVSSLADAGTDSPIGKSGPILVSGGAFEYLGANVTWNRPVTIGDSGATISVSSSGALRPSGALSGTGKLTKTGLGQLDLRSPNSYSGGTDVLEGALRIDRDSSASVGTNTLTLAGNVESATLQFGGDTQVLPNVLQITSTNNFITGSGNNTINNVAGNGTLTINSGNVFTIQGSMTAFGGTLIAGTLPNLRMHPSTGSSSAAFDLGTGSCILNNRESASGGVTIHLGALTGGASTSVRGAANDDGDNRPSTYSIGGLNLDTTFDGIFSEYSPIRKVNVLKVGTGRLTLTGTSTHTGSTTVSNGVLALSFNGSTDGSIDSSTNINVVAGSVLDVTGRSDGTLQLGGSQTLMGGGTVRGSLNATGTVSPGASVGTLTVTNAVTLNGTTLMELNTANPGQTNDVLAGQAGITYGGTLTVTNIGPALVAGQRFVLFSGAISGGFGTVNLPTSELNGTTYTWTDNLVTDGSITVATVFSPVSPNPTNIVSSVSGTDLTLSWPDSHKGWTLQTQTNSRSVGLTVATNTWFDVANSAATNSVIIPLNKVDPTVFFRLRLPQP